MNGGIFMENRIFLGLDNGNAYTKSSEGFSCQSGFTKSDVEANYKTKSAYISRYLL